MFEEIANIIEKYSPVLSAALTATNPIAGKIFDSIVDYFDGDPEKPEELAKKIEQDPDNQNKIIEIEAKYKNFELNIKIGND